MQEIYRLTPEEVLGSFTEAVRQNFFKLDLELQQDINRNRTPDQFMMSLARNGDVLFNGKTITELEALIDDIRGSVLSRRVGGNRLLGFLEGNVSVLRKIPDMKIDDLVRLTDRFLPLSTD